MKAKIVVLAGACALIFAACGMFGGAGPAAKSALEIVAPIAAEALSDLIRKRYGADVDKESAGCYALPEFTTDEDGFDYVLCRAKAVE
jgi:hypothetical protein